MQRLPPQFYLQDIAAINGHVLSCKLRVTTDPSYKWSIQRSSPFISYYPRLTPRKTPKKPQDKSSGRKTEIWYVGHWNTHKGARAMCILVHLPEMEVHARSEDCEDHELETVHGFIVSMNTQQDVGVRTHTTRHGRNTRHVKHQQLYRKRNSRDIRTWRCIDANMFVTENTSGNRNDHEWAQKNCACKY
jgi:hypothetical protein